LETKKRRLSIKLTSEDFDDIHQKANQSGKNITDYVTSVCLGKQIVVINDLEEVLKQQRAIGRNLNQLATLANMGRISVANLSEALEVLTDISESLKELLERRRWSA
jgi:uncharacterized protein (DUF1778 family)